MPLSIVFFFILSSLYSISFSDPRTSQARLHCGTSRPSVNTSNSFIRVFVSEMENLSQLISNQTWGVSSLNTVPPMYGLAQCFGDLTRTDCIICYAAIRGKIPSCLPSTSARIYLDGCFLRYDDYFFYNQSVDAFLDSSNCTSSVRSISSNSSAHDFSLTVDKAISTATKTAILGFGVAEAKGSLETVYAMAQCWKTLSRNGCRLCLEKASNEIRRCMPSREGRGLNAGCYLRYSTSKFYGQGEDTGSSRKLSTGVIAAVILGAVTFFILSLGATYAAYTKLSKLKKDRHNLRQISAAFRKSSFYFKYETLENATNYFDSSRKLGQGGSATVYMGSLPNGRTVAVKRLVFNTRQWADEFFNEVNLIGGIQHKNLVKLLGCSIEGPESLLVYEYVPNKSIDDFMSVKGMLGSLKWKQRLNIIIGTAEGLAYLHGGTNTRIIHRDIKCSNVLLDENLDAKIADFGLARCFGPDKTHLSTGVAGTLGYMAPEYLVRGQLTEKADVYSFGIVVLEIVCGRKNNIPVEGSSSLLQTVWQLFKSNTLHEVIDPSLGGDSSGDEVSSVLKIALLCTQASPSLRPSMTETVQMLTHKVYEIPAPTQPPFMNANNALNPSFSAQSYSVSSAASTKIEGRMTSSESSKAKD